MRPPAVSLFAVLSLWTAALAHAGGSVRLEKGDWALQCDNTGTCRAVGYQPADFTKARVSMRLTRRAGAGTPVEAELQAIAAGQQHRWTGPLSLEVGEVALKGLRPTPARLPAAQVPPMLRAMVTEPAAAVRGGTHRWTLSLAGLPEVLARMDEVQGRSGTRAALVQPGALSESAVPPAQALPVIVAALPVPARRSDAGLAKAVFAEINPDDHDVCAPPIEASSQLSLRRLGAATVLVSARCLNGVYDGDRHWIARIDAPHQPRLLEGIEGRFDAARGTITEFHKLAGRGTCYVYRQWQYTDHGFVLAHEHGDAMCNGFPDGAWDLPVFLSRVQRPASSSFSNRVKSS